MNKRCFGKYINDRTCDICDTRGRCHMVAESKYAAKEEINKCKDEWDTLVEHCPYRRLHVERFDPDWYRCFLSKCQECTPSVCSVIAEPIQKPFDEQKADAILSKMDYWKKELQRLNLIGVNNES